MSENPFVVFRKFQSEAAAVDQVLLLQKHGIECKTETILVPVVTNESSGEKKEYAVKVKQDDFERTDILLLKLAKENLKYVPHDYYLYQLQDETLQQILSNPYKVNHIDFLLANNILKAREEKRREQAETIAYLKTRTINLSNTKNLATGWIILGYALAALGGALGIIFGWQLFYQTKMVDGFTAYRFSVRDRKHGWRMIAVGVAYTLWWIAYKIFF